MHKFPFYNSTIKSNAPLEYIFSDVWGPSPEIPIDGFKYYLIFFYHNTKYIWLFPTKQKFDVSIIFPKFKKVVEKLFKSPSSHSILKMVVNLSILGPSLKTMGFLTLSLLHIPLNIMQPPNIVIDILLKQVTPYYIMQVSL